MNHRSTNSGGWMHSLCQSCISRREVRSGSGAVFTLCRQGLADRRWPKYPPQPVSQCTRYQASAENDADEQDRTSDP